MKGELLNAVIVASVVLHSTTNRFASDFSVVSGYC